MLNGGSVQRGHHAERKVVCLELALGDVFAQLGRQAEVPSYNGSDQAVMRKVVVAQALSVALAGGKYAGEIAGWPVFS